MTTTLPSPLSKNLMSPSSPPIINPEESGQLFDVIPDGFEWGKFNRLHQIISI